jgi:hypothetical protein
VLVCAAPKHCDATPLCRCACRFLARFCPIRQHEDLRRLRLRHFGQATASVASRHRAVVWPTFQHRRRRHGHRHQGTQCTAPSMARSFTAAVPQARCRLHEEQTVLAITIPRLPARPYCNLNASPLELKWRAHLRFNCKPPAVCVADQIPICKPPSVADPPPIPLVQFTLYQPSLSLTG